MKTTYIKMFAGLGNQLFQYSYGYFLYQQGLKVNYILNKSYNSFGQCVDFPGIFKWDDKKLKLIAPKGILKNICLFFTKLWAKYIVRNYNTGYYQNAETVETVSEKNNNLKLKLNFIREENYYPKISFYTYIQKRILAFLRFYKKKILK